MDTNSSNEKKPKRPRIGASAGASSESRFEKVTYGERSTTPRDEHNQNYGSDEQPRRTYQPRPYQPRQQNGYQPRYNQNREGGYQPRYNNQGNRYNNYGNNGGGYQPRYNHSNTVSDDAIAGNDGEQQMQHGGYQPRYNHNRQQGGYQPRYNQNRQQGGYQPRQQGGYKPRYNNTGADGEPQQTGYQPRYNQGNRYGSHNNGYGNNNGAPQKRRYNNNAGGGRYQQQGQSFPRPGKSFVPRPKRVEYEQPEVDPNEEIRLNKFMANAGICSRREADEHIQNGMVKVNGNVVTELGTKITAKDVVEFRDKVVTSERKCYILLNKPKDCVTTSDDPNGRLTVMDLVKNACEERIYPVGRLDRNTTGVLLLTNDGDLASKLTHPQYVKKKIYHVWTDKDISEDDMQRIADGIDLDDGPIHADAISYATETDRNQAGIEIHSGRNRIVRRIFESLGYHVTKLDRVYFAGLTKKNLPRGRWRYLTQEEVNFLKMGSFE